MASDNGENYTLILPEDLLIKIFLKSSVDSLIRAKCVCKYWYGLVKDPSFAYKHLQYQKEMKKTRLLLQYFKEETQLQNYAILDDITQSSSTYHNLCYLHVTKHFLYMEGPVDGLYCLFNGKDRIVLWNPALMDFKTLPLPPPHFLPHYRVYLGQIGFGTDLLTNDYKVVLIRTFWNTMDDYKVDNHNFGSVYTLSTDSWKDLDLEEFFLCDYTFNENLSSLFLGGTYYWLGSVGLDSEVVIAFDMGKETFRVIPGPDISQFVPEDIICSAIAVYEDRIALLLFNELIHIWLMSEEGIWIKQISVGPFTVLFCPLGFWKNEGLFLVINDSESNMYDPDSNSKMVLYDFSSQEMRNMGPRATFCSFRTCVYYESLTAVYGGTSCKVNLDLWKQVSEFLDN